MIGGNKLATLEIKTTKNNSIGEPVDTWTPYTVLKGFLDLMSGGADYQNYNAKIQESTHVFIGDYVPINLQESECRLVVDGKPYEITLIDNPMELNKHIEIYLKYTGD